MQECVRNGKVELLKVAGTENPADIFTKYLDASIMNKALEKDNCKFMDGRPACAPPAAGTTSEKKEGGQAS